MASETGIANRALQRLGAARITALDDTSSTNSRACNVAYEPLRDALLRAHPWSFAIARASLAADSTAPAFGPAYQYAWPTTAMRILLPKDHTLDWIVEGRFILSDWTAPLEVRYISKVEDPTRWTRCSARPCRAGWPSRCAKNLPSRTPRRPRCARI